MAKVRKGQSARLIAQILLILLLSLLLWGILFFEAARTATALRCEKAAQTTLVQTVCATGYIFRDEMAVTTHDNGPVLYEVANGVPVTAGAAIATVYADGANIGTRALAAELLAEIERLQTFDEPDYLPDYYGSYHEMMASLSGGELSGTDAAREQVQAALDLIRARREENAVREARIAALQAELAVLIENDLNAMSRVQAPASGVFYRTVDGYESVMSVAAIDTLTPGGLRALLLSPQSTADMIGRVLVGGVWYLAVPYQAAKAEAFVEGASYDIDFLRTREKMTLTLARVTAADTAGEVLLIFRADSAVFPADLARSEEVRISVGEQSGILVPMVALREEKGVPGVYVAVDGKASFRAVEVLIKQDGCCLVTLSSKNGFLQVDEEIVVTSRRIFEGKMLS